VTRSTEAGATAERPDPPLRVDWLAPDDLPDGLPGRLGLTFLPGKNGPSFRYPGRVYRRELAADLAALAGDGVRTLVLLVEDHELERWGDPEIVARGRAGGIEVVRRPIPDETAPRSAAEMDEILDVVRAARGAGDVAVACMGGVGRTGTVVACALVAAGRGADQAIGRVRAVRHPTAVETGEQIGFVHHYERHVAERARSRTVAP
jgi:protein-tyrosine phosphatase